MAQRQRPPQPNGKKWNPNYILDALRNRTYIGELFFRDTWHIAPHEPLVDLDTFERGQRLLSARGENHRLRRSNASDYLLSGVVVCKSCDKHYLGTAAHGRHARYRYYSCHTRMRQGRESCAADTLPADALEEQVLSALIETLNQPGLLDKAL